MCVVKDCYQMGALGPAGAFYCGNHISSAIARCPPKPRAKFEDTGAAQNGKGEGMSSFPDAVIVALIDNVDPVGPMDVADVVEELTDRYGFGMLDNAMCVRRANLSRKEDKLAGIDPRQLSDDDQVPAAPRSASDMQGKLRPIIAQGRVSPQVSSVPTRPQAIPQKAYSFGQPVETFPPPVIGGGGPVPCPCPTQLRAVPCLDKRQLSVRFRTIPKARMPSCRRWCTK